jgi:hypothetical protein
MGFKAVLDSLKKWKIYLRPVKKLDPLVVQSAAESLYLQGAPGCPKVIVVNTLRFTLVNTVVTTDNVVCLHDHSIYRFCLYHLLTHGLFNCIVVSCLCTVFISFPISEIFQYTTQGNALQAWIDKLCRKSYIFAFRRKLAGVSILTGNKLNFFRIQMCG